MYIGMYMRVNFGPMKIGWLTLAEWLLVYLALAAAWAGGGLSDHERPVLAPPRLSRLPRPHFAPPFSWSSAVVDGYDLGTISTVISAFFGVWGGWKNITHMYLTTYMPWRHDLHNYVVILPSPEQIVTTWTWDRISSRWQFKKTITAVSCRPKLRTKIGENLK
jgi:hypothetical protein